MGGDIQEFKADRLKYLLKGLASVAVAAAVLMLIRGDRLTGPAAVPILLVLGLEIFASFWHAASSLNF